MEKQKKIKAIRDYTYTGNVYRVSRKELKNAFGGEYYIDELIKNINNDYYWDLVKEKENMSDIMLLSTEIKFLNKLWKNRKK